MGCQPVNDCCRSPRLAILGASGIGDVHARVIHHLGGKVVAILGRTEESTATTSDRLDQRFGFRPHPHTCLDNLLSEQPLDGVVVSTPPQYHADQLLTLGRLKIPVFCEKPLFDAAGSSHEAAWRTLDSLKRHGAMPAFLGISNSYFASGIPFRGSKNIQRLAFSFHTNGPHRNAAIAWDLLPHGFSILHALGINGPITNARHQVAPYRFQADFLMGGADVSFDFCQGPDIGKHFCITINGDQIFERVQQGQGQTYRVFLRNAKGELLKIEDPFVSAMRDFFHYMNGRKMNSPCQKAEANMRQVLLFAGCVGLLP